MITPEEIRHKASQLFEPAVDAWLAGDSSFFPRRLRGNLQVGKTTTQPELIAQVSRLREHSKVQKGYGYRIVYSSVRSRSHGLNDYPTAIEFESRDDLLRLIGRSADFRMVEQGAAAVRGRFPSLEDWLKGNWKKLIGIAHVLDDLLLVSEYMLLHPRPGCYVRELPLPVSSKLIHANQALLREWWDRLLPQSSIDFGAIKHFERRYGFRYPRQHLLLRVLDEAFGQQLGFPCDELSLPAEELQRLLTRTPHERLESAGEAVCRIVIVENKINLLTLPPLKRTLALGGMGNNLAEFQRVPHLKHCRLEYWGDLDEAGLMILARVRRCFPHARSRLMDGATLDDLRHLATGGIAATSTEEPPELEAGELQALRRCRQLGWRIEQEHIPQTCVNLAFDPLA